MNILINQTSHELPDGATLADAIAAEAPRSELRRLVEAGGMRLILSQARQRVLAGESTLEEMQRAVGLE